MKTLETEHEMIISAIVAVAHGGVIGKHGQIPWYLPADLQYFKRVTLNHHLIMGRKTFMSIGKPLPHRVNVVVTRNPFFVADGCLVVSSVGDALTLAWEHGETECFIIGGGDIYAQSMYWWDRVYRTDVDLHVEGGDTFFPELSPEEWRLVSEAPHQPDEKNEYAYNFKVFERIRQASGQ